MASVSYCQDSIQDTLTRTFAPSPEEILRTRLPTLCTRSYNITCIASHLTIKKVYVLDYLHYNYIHNNFFEF
jgi:hypothetical protein